MAIGRVGKSSRTITVKVINAKYFFDNLLLYTFSFRNLTLAAFIAVLIMRIREHLSPKLCYPCSKARLGKDG